MDKLWRPCNWNNPYESSKEPLGIGDEDYLAYESFELGADAMLETLRKAPCDGTQIISGGIWEGKNKFPYKLLFIPLE
jgi:hypothetical protein